MADKQANRYSRIMSELFAAHYRRGKKSFTFAREEIEETARKLGIKLPKNLGDVIYSFRYRTSFPSEITKTAPPGFEWHIEGAGRSQYRFQLVRISRIVPSDSLFVTKIPDATPEIIAKHALRDEQALLAKVRYNRLIDIFLHITAFSLQNHLRTTVPNIGQIETDEIYVGVRNTGQQFIVPVQA